MAPALRTRIIAALGNLDRVQTSVHGATAKADTDYEAAMQQLEEAKKRRNEVIAAATADTEAIQHRIEALGQALTSNMDDLEAGEIEELLQPFCKLSDLLCYVENRRAAARPYASKKYNTTQAGTACFRPCALMLALLLPLYCNTLCRLLPEHICVG